MSTLKNLPVSLPFTPISPGVDAASIALSFLPHLSSVQSQHFLLSAVWRDLSALTGILSKICSRTDILTAWYLNANTGSKTTNFQLAESSALVFTAGLVCWVRSIFSFEVGVRQFLAIISLVPGEDGKWGDWLLRRILHGLEGEGSVDTLESKTDILNSDVKVQEIEQKESHGDCVIVGSGQVGLDVAQRLETLGVVDCVALEKNAEVGDNWKNRYDHCKSHLPREAARLPFERTFGPGYWECLTKDNLAQGYKDWVNRYNFNVWTSTTLLSGSWNTSTKSWTLIALQRNSERTLTCSDVLLAIGGGGQISKIPHCPDLGLTPSHNHQLSAKVTLKRHCSPLSIFRKRFFLERKGQLAVHYFERFGGHYLDVRKSKKISEGMIKVKGSTCSM